MGRTKERGRDATLVFGGVVVTMNPERTIYRNGAILIRGNRIEAVGRADDMQARYREARRFDARDHVIIPGLIDTHVHLSEHIIRSLVPDDAGDWMSRWLMPVYASLSPEDEYTSAMLAFIEMAKTGTTTFCEAGTLMHPEAAAEALQRIGLRGILGRWTWDLPAAPARMKATTDQALAAMEALLARMGRLGDDKISAWPILLGMGTASDELMRGAKALADRFGVGMGMMHASSIPSMETRDTIQSLRQFESRGLLGSNLKLTHMVHVDDSDLEVLKRHKVKVSHCPTAAMKHCKGLNKFGKFPEMLEKGVCVSLGADSANGSDHIDMLRIMNTVACIFKDSRMTASVMPAETVLEMATIRGAEALMLEDEIGSIEAGKKADLVLFDRSHPEWRPLLNIANSLVYSASACGIDAVFVDGKAVVENGRTRNVDESEIYRNADGLALRLLERANLPVPSKWPVV